MAEDGWKVVLRLYLGFGAIQADIRLARTKVRADLGAGTTLYLRSSAPAACHLDRETLNDVSGYPVLQSINTRLMWVSTGQAMFLSCLRAANSIIDFACILQATSQCIEAGWGQL